MKTFLQWNRLWLLASLPFLVAAALTVPEKADRLAQPELDSCNLDCTEGGQRCTRRDFNLMQVEYRRDSYHEYAQQAGYAWSFSSTNSYVVQDARLILTWELKPEMQNTTCGDQIMAKAQYGSTQDPWYLQVRFVGPYQHFNGNASVNTGTYRIVKEIPLGNLQPSSYGSGLQYRLQFGVVYQQTPTCMSYQDPNDLTIEFMPEPPTGGRRGGGDTSRTPQLTWTTSITETTLGQPPADYLVGKTLSDIVNSRISGRPDGMMCNACHTGNAGINYRPPVSNRSSSTEITPSLSISQDGTRGSGYRWSDSGSLGIVYHFTQNSINKPGPLEAAFEKWLSDGGQ